MAKFAQKITIYRMVNSINERTQSRKSFCTYFVKVQLQYNYRYDGFEQVNTPSNIIVNTITNQYNYRDYAIDKK